MLRGGLWTVAITFLTSAVQATGADVSIELNKLEPNGGACRAYLVLENGTAQSFEALKLDLVMFDTDGIVAKRVAVQTAPLAAGKTSLKVFDMTGLPCERVGRLLLNDVMDCMDADGARKDCLGLLSASQRGAVPFIK